jgi:hypothetical protein
MAALLSATRPLARRRCYVDAFSLRILFTRKMSYATDEAICIPELVSGEDTLEIDGRVGDS